MEGVIIFKIVDKHEAYEDLANAIIIQAAKDYRNALRRVQPEKVAVLEKFFSSEWYRALTDVDGSYLIWKIKEEEEV